MTIAKKNIDSILYIVLFCLVVFLFVSRYAKVYIPCLAIISLICVFRNKTTFPKEILFFLLFILINFLQFSFFYNSRSGVEIIKNIIYVALFFSIYNLKIRYEYFIKIWRVVFLFCFFVQIVQFLGLFNINSFLVDFYGDSVYLTEYSRNISLTNFRSGSVFINVNPYWKFSILSLIVFFYHIRKKNSIDRKDIFFVLLAVLSTLLTGSRTGTFISLCILSAHFLTLLKNKHRKMAIIGLLFLLPLMFFFSDKLINARGFDFQHSSSLTFKIRRIAAFFDNDLFNIFFGLGAYDYIGQEDSAFMDSDYGYALSYYGIVGFVAYIAMLINCFGMKKMTTQNKAFTLSVLLLIFTGALTDGIYFNYRIFSLFLLTTIPVHNGFYESKKLSY